MSTVSIAIWACLFSGLVALSQPSTGAVPHNTGGKDWRILLPDSDAKAVAVAQCLGCHGLQQVVQARGTQDFWSDTVWTMVSHGADISREDADVLVPYFSSAFGLNRPRLVVPVNLNTASVEILRLLPPVSAHAEDIIQRRLAVKRFEKLEDLLDVKGITKQNLDDIRPFVSLPPDSPAR